MARVLDFSTMENPPPKSKKLLPSQSAWIHQCLGTSRLPYIFYEFSRVKVPSDAWDSSNSIIFTFFFGSPLEPYLESKKLLRSQSVWIHEGLGTSRLPHFFYVFLRLNAPSDAWDSSNSMIFTFFPWPQKTSDHPNRRQVTSPILQKSSHVKPNWCI